MRALILTLVLACNPPDTDTDTEVQEYFERTLDVRGAQRGYVVFLPASTAEAMESGPVPLLTAVHDNDDTPRNLLEWTGLDQLARDNGFAIVAPAAYEETWLANYEVWPGDDGQGFSGPNDIIFLGEVVSAASAEFSFDPTKTVAVGHGLGAGMLAYQLTGTGQQLVYDETFTTPYRAFGLNAGFHPTDSVSASAADPKRPAWITQGSEDTTYAFTGEDLAEDLERHDYEVEFTMVDGVGHIWMWQEDLGQSNQDLWDWLMLKAEQE